jgi:hypothetical protein
LTLLSSITGESEYFLVGKNVLAITGAHVGILVGLPWSDGFALGVGRSDEETTGACVGKTVITIVSSGVGTNDNWGEIVGIVVSNLTIVGETVGIGSFVGSMVCTGSDVGSLVITMYGVGLSDSNTVGMFVGLAVFSIVVGKNVGESVCGNDVGEKLAWIVGSNVDDKNVGESVVCGNDIGERVAWNVGANVDDTNVGISVGASEVTGDGDGANGHKSWGGDPVSDLITLYEEVIIRLKSNEACGFVVVHKYLQEKSIPGCCLPSKPDKYCNHCWKQ